MSLNEILMVKPGPRYTLAVKCILNQHVLKTYIDISYCLAALTVCPPNCKLPQVDNLKDIFICPCGLRQREVEPHVVNWPVSGSDRYSANLNGLLTLLCCGDIVRGKCIQNSYFVCRKISEVL